MASRHHSFSVNVAFRQLILLALLLGAGIAAAQMPRIELSAGIHRISAELANTDANRQRGMMFRKTLLPQEGMLFVFERSERVCMWMKNTYLPLSVAFLDEQGVILNIADMTPHSEESHCASKAARFALEMNVGWFDKRGLGAGVKISGTDRVRPIP